MKIAVVSSDKIKVNGRFGTAERFLIYEKDDEGMQLIGERLSEPFLFDFLDSDMCDWVADIIQDCQKVYISRICKAAEKAVARRGITPVLYSGPIDQIR